MEECSDLWENPHARSSQSPDFCLLILKNPQNRDIEIFRCLCTNTWVFFFNLKMIENYIIIRLEYPEFVINSFWLTIILQEKCG